MGSKRLKRSRQRRTRNRRRSRNQRRSRPQKRSKISKYRRKRTQKSRRRRTRQMRGGAAEHPAHLAAAACNAHLTNVFKFVSSVRNLDSGDETPLAGELAGVAEGFKGGRTELAANLDARLHAAWGGVGGLKSKILRKIVDENKKIKEAAAAAAATPSEGVPPGAGDEGDAQIADSWRGEVEYKGIKMKMWVGINLPEVILSNGSPAQHGIFLMGRTDTQQIAKEWRLSYTITQDGEGDLHYTQGSVITAVRSGWGMTKKVLTIKFSDGEEWELKFDSQGEAQEVQKILEKLNSRSISALATDTGQKGL